MSSESDAERRSEFGMNPIVSERKQDLARLCEERRVERLDVFGSAVTGDFDPETSDLDFLVTFRESAADGDAFKRQIGLKDALEALFGRKVDVVPERSITNEYFRANVEDTREAVYPNWDNSTNAARRGNKAVITRRIQCSLLRDIVENAKVIRELTAGKTLRDYLSDGMLQDCVERHYLTIGESVAQMAKRAPAVAERISDHQKIIGFGKFLLHRYREIDSEKVWTYTVEYLPTLLREAVALLAEREDE